MDEINNFCNTGLALGLGLSYSNNNLDSNRSSQIPPSPDQNEEKEQTTRLLKFDDHVLPISLSLGTPTIDGSPCQLYRQSSSTSPGSSYSNSIGNNNNNNNNNRIKIKRERLLADHHQHQFCGEEEVELDDKAAAAAVGVASDHDHDEDEDASPRKKLRLNREQSAILEDAFKEHSTLNPNQKQALAKQLNLRPRQVEVWFQNRRARTKLKQTEMDLELLKKCCETLTEENKKLHKELQQLKLSPPVYMHMPTTTLTMCPSCERIMTTAATSASASSTVVAGGGGGGDSSVTNIKGMMTTFSMEQQNKTSPQEPKFCNSPFTTAQSYAAC